jgi:carboxymethylenebutenolidase
MTAMPIAASLLALALQAAPAPAPTAVPVAGPRDPNLPPSELQAKAALESSSRHGEYVDVKTASGTAIRTYVVYPESKAKAPVVVVIQEIFGLSDWIRGVADQLARDGFIAVAPDMISGLGPNGGGTDSVASRDDVVKLTRALTPEETAARLAAVREYAAKIPASTGKVGVVGFCWGGARAFEQSMQPGVSAAVVYYGSSPDTASLAKVQAPVLGLYGADDARVNATVPPAQEEMKRLGKPYEAIMYEGAGHGFLRQQEGREGANLKASQQAWPKTLAFFREKLR